MGSLLLSAKAGSRKAIAACLSDPFSNNSSCLVMKALLILRPLRSCGYSDSFVSKIPMNLYAPLLLLNCDKKTLHDAAIVSFYGMNRTRFQAKNPKMGTAAFSPFLRSREGRSLNYHFLSLCVPPDWQVMPRVLLFHGGIRGQSRLRSAMSACGVQGGR